MSYKQFIKLSCFGKYIMWVGGSPGLDDKYLLVIAATWQSIVWSNIANQVGN
jgi:hypothetical protein